MDGLVGEIVSLRAYFQSVMKARYVMKAARHALTHNHSCILLLMHSSGGSRGGGVPGVPWNPLNFAKCGAEKYGKISCVHKRTSVRSHAQSVQSKSTDSVHCMRVR